MCKKICFFILFILTFFCCAKHFILQYYGKKKVTILLGNYLSIAGVLPKGLNFRNNGFSPFRHIISSSKTIHKINVAPCLRTIRGKISLIDATLLIQNSIKSSILKIKCPSLFYPNSIFCFHYLYHSICLF